MKVVLFCGGQGTRIREYSDVIPKPMIPVGGRPILERVMDVYARHGHRDFILCAGYQAEAIASHFGATEVRAGRPRKLANAPRRRADGWNVTVVDTGLWSNIGMRLQAIRPLIGDDEIFCANYADGLTDADLGAMRTTFEQSGKIACFLAVRPPVTFHIADIDRDGRVRAMNPAETCDLWINGGYFFFRREVFTYMRDGEELVCEPFARLIADNQIMAIRHEGFFRSMDTMRDRQALEALFADQAERRPQRASA
jgi:glucose-1-phosphate cytidylyltransferase